jgi:hypothetical protein
MMPTLLTATAHRHEAPAPAALLDSYERQRLTGSALAATSSLASAWQLTVDEVCALLGGVAPSTWHSWHNKAPADLGIDRLMRISYLLGIYSALHALHQGSLADEWIRRPNTNRLFNGSTPLEGLIVGGIPAMVEVRALLDSRRGGG